MGGGVATTGIPLTPLMLALHVTYSSGHVIWHSVSGDGVRAAILTERY